MLHTIWTETKETVLHLLPYAVIVWLMLTMQTQQQRLVDQHMEALQSQAAAQFTVLSAIRDTLTQRGLVVPPLGGTN
jgi:large-conductance mechanosensitive channel